MSAVLQFTATLESTGPCPACGVECAMPPNMVRARRADKLSFYCPNGHPQAFIKGRVAELEEQLAAAKANAERERIARVNAVVEADIARSERDTAQAKLARTKKRVGHGVCPCCNRTVKQLARHMKSKHPDYADVEVGS